jgi:hypothetical protein
MRFAASTKPAVMQTGDCPAATWQRTERVGTVPGPGTAWVQSGSTARAAEPGRAVEAWAGGQSHRKREASCLCCIARLAHS